MSGLDCKSVLESAQRLVVINPGISTTFDSSGISMGDPELRVNLVVARAFLFLHPTAIDRLQRLDRQGGHLEVSITLEVTPKRQSPRNIILLFTHVAKDNARLMCTQSLFPAGFSLIVLQLGWAL